MANKRAVLNVDNFDVNANRVEEETKLAAMEQVDVKPVERKSERLIFFIEPSIKEKIVKRAKAMNTSYAEVAKDALVEYIEKYGL